MKNLMLLSILSLFVINSYCQIPATTEDGKKVILNEDGTWKYLDDNVLQAVTESYTCDDLIKTTTDKMTGKSTFAAQKRVEVYNENSTQGFGIFIYKKGRSIVFNMQIKGASPCIRDDSKILILFRNGKRLELVNDGEANCNAFFDLYFDGAYGKTKELKMFAKQEVESFRIWTAQAYVEQDFEAAESKQLMFTIDCLMKTPGE